jgi:hypothetical protein
MQALVDELQITSTALRCKASEAVYEDHKQFFRDRADLLRDLADDMTAGRAVDRHYAETVLEEFKRLT